MFFTIRIGNYYFKNWELKGETMTNKLDQLYFDSIVLDVNANSIKQSYQILAEHISQLIGTPKQYIIFHLMAAEKNETAAVGNGIAIPHMRLERLTRPMVVFMKLNKGVSCDSHDGLPADLFCLVLSPDYEGVKHIQRLSMVSRCFKNEDFCKKLRNVKSKADVRNALKEMNQKRAAAA